MATNTKYDSGRRLTVAVASGVVSGDVVISGRMIGVALTSRDTSGNAVVDFGGVYNLSVKGVDDAGNVAVAAGDELFYVDGDTPKISKKRTGWFAGIALAAVTSGSTTTIAVKLIERTSLPPVFKSSEQTGTGSSQNIAHGLGVTPSLVLVYPTDTSPATAGVYVLTEGTHTSTNVVVTVTTGKKFKVVAFA